MSSGGHNCFPVAVLTSKLMYIGRNIDHSVSMVFMMVRQSQLFLSVNGIIVNNLQGLWLLSLQGCYLHKQNANMGKTFDN